MAKQVFYPIYALFICLYAIRFIIVGTSVAKLMDTTLPKMNEKKHSGIILLEILFQVCLNCVLFYAMREYTHSFVLLFANMRTYIYGSPAKYAELIISPTVFMAQPNLMKKISYLWGVKLTNL